MAEDRLLREDGPGTMCSLPGEPIRIDDGVLLC